ncbi:MAG: putative tRNA threonylcarbamoyladenosine biosynthesis protein Gcp [Parcubacteria group bacterium GW2011_GWA2_39_18]|nr:MAG: putative tRNA threonylcarbamoyladenosine biosynthesis protein Gcp [Parcubacteria group bacterium GW2011_GWA2_39_18]
MLILSIETSCDDTGAAILKVKGSTKNPSFEVLANTTSSQDEIHSPFGGIVPNLACRAHEENLPPVIYNTLVKAKEKLKIDTKTLIKKIDFITVTSGPGLSPSLLMGVSAAKALAFSWKKKIVPVNHLVAHIYANFLENPHIRFPALALIVSGGHTQLVLMKKHLDFKTIGKTRDDAAGETFDKAARILEIGYPGGPAIAKRAEAGNPDAFNLPRPMLNTKDYNFSFSGLKTAILYLVKSLGKLSEKQKDDLCASIQEAIVEVLVTKTIRAAKKYKVKSIILGGGVAANEKLVSEMKKTSKKMGTAFYPHTLDVGKNKNLQKKMLDFNIQKNRFQKEKGVGVYCPKKSLCTDNAQMIAVASYYLKNKATSWKKIKVDANWKI